MTFTVWKRTDICECGQDQKTCAPKMSACCTKCIHPRHLTEDAWEQVGAYPDLLTAVIRAKDRQLHGLVIGVRENGIPIDWEQANL